MASSLVATDVRHCRVKIWYLRRLTDNIGFASELYVLGSGSSLNHPAGEFP